METIFQLNNNGIEAWPQFLTSLAIGLLIGLERERTPSAKAGLRTFALVAMFGTLSALLSTEIDAPWLLIAGLLAVAGMIIAAYHNKPAEANDPGTTTIIALLLCYGLGAMVWFGLAKLAVMLAIAVTALLYFKPELRGMSQRLTRGDLVAVLQFAVLTFIVLPILPDKNFGPYDAFNPHQAWLMVVLISGISLAGYTALHVVGTRYGAPLLGFLGGLVSSTATTLLYARNSRNNPAMSQLAASVIVIASMVVLLRLLVLSSVVAYGALPGLIPMLACGFLFGLAVALYNWQKKINAAKLSIPETPNPAELRTALGFGLLYVVVLLGGFCVGVDRCRCDHAIQPAPVKSRAIERTPGSHLDRDRLHCQPRLQIRHGDLHRRKKSRQICRHRLRRNRFGSADRAGCVIIRPLSSKRQRHLMEAEQLNALANQLQDLTLRNAELRRYL